MSGCLASVPKVDWCDSLRACLATRYLSLFLTMPLEDLFRKSVLVGPCALDKVATLCELW